jgi:hypothetical protein
LYYSLKNASDFLFSFQTAAVADRQLDAAAPASFKFQRHATLYCGLQALVFSSRWAQWFILQHSAPHSALQFHGQQQGPL